MRLGVSGSQTGHASRACESGPRDTFLRRWCGVTLRTRRYSTAARNGPTRHTRDTSTVDTRGGGAMVVDPYTGQTINFVRGPDSSSAVQIDTTWCRWPTPDTKVRAAGITNTAGTSLTTRGICWPSARRPTSIRLFGTPRDGCPRTRRFAASSSPARLRSRRNTGCGCRAGRRTRCGGCCGTASASSATMRVAARRRGESGNQT